jgi:hypothetical protein
MSETTTITNDVTVTMPSDRVRFGTMRRGTLFDGYGIGTCRLMIKTFVLGSNGYLVSRGIALADGTSYAINDDELVRPLPVGTVSTITAGPQ